MRPSAGAITYNEQLQGVVACYRDADQPWPATMKQVASWALEQGLWRPQRDSLIRQCAAELAKALREEYIIDAQGRTVRAKHAARIEVDGEQQMLWEDIRTGNRKHMEISFQQRRQQIVGDCHQLKVDVDSFNENANKGVIQMIFDFTDDLAELEALEQQRRRRRAA